MNPGSRGVKVITPHFPVLQGARLIISPILQGRVAPEDWGPILAPSLTFYRQLKKSYNIGALFRLLPGLLLFLGFSHSPICSSRILLTSLLVALSSESSSLLF